MSKTVSLCLCATALLIAGCKVGPNFKEPQRTMPDGWATPPSTQPTTRTSVATAETTNVARWWQNFNDPVLARLVERAMQSNLDLRQAHSRIVQARAQRGVEVAAFWPNANVGASYSKSGTSGNSTTFVDPVTGTTSSRTSGGTRDSYRAGFDASWELDVFGGVRRGIEAAEADIAASIEDQRDVLILITSEVALNYVNLRGFQRQITIAQENLQSQLRSADLTRRRQRGGLVSGLDVANAEAQVASTRSQIPLLEQNARQTLYNIALLLGQEPSALVAELEQPTEIPPTPANVPIGLPSELLRRRPDIRRAEQQLHSATARVGVATADLFPRFSLTGQLGTTGSEFSALGNWSSRFWSVGPSISWPIFSAGRIRANIAVQNAVQEQAAMSYEQAVLTALNDVEVALVAYSREQEHRQSLVEAVAANRRAVDLATQLYTQGQTGFLDVLSAQRSLYVSEDALVRSDTTVATNLVALYKALGGGWE
jgi:NodT family efflux transporter outer membrane factor (OMF) lipoprotein